MAKKDSAVGFVVDPSPAPVEREALLTFAQNHEAGQRIELMGGFMYYAQSRGWTHATRAEWVQRYERFRYSEGTPSSEEG